MAGLLSDWDDRIPWKRVVGSVTATDVLRGSVETGLLVVEATAPVKPAQGDVQALFKERVGTSADPVLVAVEYEAQGVYRICVMGPTVDSPVVDDLDRGVAERLIESALTNDSPAGVHAEVRRRLGSLERGVAAGFRNEGLFASHVLEKRPGEADWTELCGRGEALLARRDEELLTALGFTLDPVPDGVVLRATQDGTRRAAAVLLKADESLDNPLGRLGGVAAITHGLAVARKEGVDWLLVLGGSVVRLVPADPDIGVGRKGQTQTYAEIDLGLLTPSTAGYLPLLASAEALASGGDVTTLLGHSARYATGLSERLRDRIYADVVPNLAVAVAERNGVSALHADDQKAALDEAYHQAMIVLFRLLFVAYAEDRGLLPIETNEAYRANALKTLGRRILDNPEQRFSSESTSLWSDLVQVWGVIDTGDLDGMGVPAYNGGLFSRDPNKNASGAAVYTLDLTNDVVGPVLRGLLIDETRDGVLGPVDFRSLDVREFGTIYEGLLESGLGVATADLSLDKDENYVPAATGDEVNVRAGQVYFHSRSGSRKATGSYFTKPFAVQHLLDSALEPALDDHLSRVRAIADQGTTRRAAQALFDFRVADLSMGSAHFLVAAIDRIEARFSAFLAEVPIPEVAQELQHLRRAAESRLGPAADTTVVDDGVLLRRQIARRCIYGVDVNEIAVELARLAVWIHTFVPGLPLSFLDHGLVWGNSLTGVGTVDEIVRAVADAERREHPKSAPPEGAESSLTAAIDDFMLAAKSSLAELADLSDASIADVQAAVDHQRSIEAELAPLHDLCGLLTAERATRHLKKDDPDRILVGASRDLFTAATADQLVGAVAAHPQLERSREIAADVQAMHLPLAFPEVFERDRPGFDVLLGNPPWEKLKVETSRWWALRFPGLRSMDQHEQDALIAQLGVNRPDLLSEFRDDVQQAEAARRIIIAGPFTAIGRGDIDLYKAFAWRFVHATRANGRIGVVMPRSLLSEKGTAAWRSFMFERSEWTDVTFLANSGRWAFEQIHPQWTITLLTCQLTGRPAEMVRMKGPAHSHEEFARLAETTPVAFPAQAFRQWGEGDSFRILATQEAAEIYGHMMQHTLLGDPDRNGWRARPFAELHSTADKPLMDLTRTAAGDDGVPVYKGESFNLWEPDTGIYYATADRDVIVEELGRRRVSGARSARSPFHEFPDDVIEDPDRLPMLSPRIAFRKIARARDSRTIIAALVPPGVCLTDGAPYLLFPRGSEVDEAYVLGFLCSRPLDWAARNVVEINVNYPQVNTLPIPDPGQENGARRRVVEIAGRLAAVDARYSDWAAKVGVPIGSVQSEGDKKELVYELDALVALLYGLSVDQLEKVFATFHRGWDHRAHLAGVLPHFERWGGTLADDVEKP